MNQLDLQVASRLADADPVIPSKLFEQLHALMDHPIPAIAAPVFELRVAVASPLLEQNCSAVLTQEVGCQSLLEAPAKEHGSPGVLLSPAIQIPVAVAARAAQILANLGIAKGHGPSPRLFWVRQEGLRVPPTPRPAQTHPG